MSILEIDPVQHVVVPAEAVALNPSWESDWGNAVYRFVQQASREGKTVTVSVVERMVTPHEAAELADVSRTTILRRIEDGTIKATKRGTHWRISESELNSYRRQVWADTVASIADDF